MTGVNQRKGPSAEREQDEVEILRMNDKTDALCPIRSVQELVVAIVRANVSMAIDLERGENPRNKYEPNTVSKATRNAALWAGEILDISSDEIEARLTAAVIEVARHGV